MSLGLLPDLGVAFIGVAFLGVETFGSIHQSIRDFFCHLSLVPVTVDDVRLRKGCFALSIFDADCLSFIASLAEVSILEADWFSFIDSLAAVSIFEADWFIRGICHETHRTHSCENF